MRSTYKRATEFQSTHPHRVRRSGVGRCKTFGGVNPRTHIGCDTSSTTTANKAASFNPRTHIGCDFSTAALCFAVTLFQSTHPHRVRQKFPTYISGQPMFQSTHPHRVRQGFSCIARQATSFNPRTHIGCDLHVLLLCPRFVSFNPRTHIGCDLMLLTLNGLMLSFNPRTHIGCDFDRYDEPCQLYVSIHAPT